MLKKMMLLAGLALVAVAYMAPAMAQADEWYTHVDGKDVTVGIGTTNADTVNFTGTLSSTASGGAVQSGPCNVHADVDVWNENFVNPETEEAYVTGTAEVTNFTITTHCPVTSPFPIIPPGCTLEKASSKGFPWHVDVLANTGIAITGANFRNVYKGCAPTLPAEIEAKGTATGTAVNGENKVCLVFANSGDLETVAEPPAPVTIDGEVCAPNLTLK
ncbi:MAG TPA: hypothetical protein VGO66_04935 [Solirubrobacterales bacterium]|jgi:hypothetical protein|nr:hypothetical protein [Solirubrobacterales bacterium]